MVIDVRWVYLGARFYDPNTGRFNRLDPFAGNSQDPQSLHKYLYAHGDPVQEVDPTGLVSLSSQLGTIGGFGITIGGILKATAVVAVAGYATYKYGSDILRAIAIAGAEPITNDEKRMVKAGLRTLHRRVPDDTKLSKLIDLFNDGAITIKKDKLPNEAAGTHIDISASGVLYVDEKAFEYGNLAVALVTYAEFQHDQLAPHRFPDDSDPGVNVEFNRIRRAVTDDELNVYIMNLRHPVPR